MKRNEYFPFHFPRAIDNFKGNLITNGAWEETGSMSTQQSIPNRKQITLRCPVLLIIFPCPVPVPYSSSCTGIYNGGNRNRTRTNTIRSTRTLDALTFHRRGWWGYIYLKASTRKNSSTARAQGWLIISLVHVRSKIPCYHWLLMAHHTAKKIWQEHVFAPARANAKISSQF